MARLVVSGVAIAVLLALAGCDDGGGPLTSAAAKSTKASAAAKSDKAPAKSSASKVPLDEGLARYKVVGSVSGNIKSVGSDTMNDLMTLWSEGFRKLYPSVRREIEGKGSSTALPALIAGTSTFGPMSRDAKSDEIDPFERKFGYPPTLLPAAIDMLAVYVHKDNPIASLSLKQVDAIYSQHRKGGHPQDITTWGDLGLTGDWQNKPISLYGRNAASGTYGYFKEHALFGGDFKGLVKELPGSSAVVQGVAGDRYAIGYSGIGAMTAGVRAVPLVGDDGEAVAPEASQAYSGAYPLARFLWVAMNQQPDAPLDPLRGEFIKYVFSQQGQSNVVKAGYFPVNAKIADKALAEVGLGK